MTADPYTFKPPPLIVGSDYSRNPMPGQLRLFVPPLSPALTPSELEHKRRQEFLTTDRPRRSNV